MVNNCLNKHIRHKEECLFLILCHYHNPVPQLSDLKDTFSLHWAESPVIRNSLTCGRNSTAWFVVKMRSTLFFSLAQFSDVIKTIPIFCFKFMFFKVLLTNNEKVHTFFNFSSISIVSLVLLWILVHNSELYNYWGTFMFIFSKPVSCCSLLASWAWFSGHVNVNECIYCVQWSFIC